MPITRAQVDLDINSKVVDNNVNVPGKTLGKNDRLNRKLIVDYLEQEIASAVAGSELVSVLQVLTSDDPVDVPDPGFYAVVHYHITGDTTPTNFPLASGTRKKYLVKNINEIGEGDITIENVEGGNLILGPGARMKLEDYGVNNYLIVG